MKKLFIFTVICGLYLFFTITNVMAADMPVKEGLTPVVKSATVTTVPEAKKMSTYPAGPIQKLERGINNAAIGWTEIPKRIVDQTKASNPIKGLFLGAYQGSLRAFARTASGFSEVFTFPLGKYDKPKVLPDMPAVMK